MSMKISADVMLGGAGCCLAAASLGFGLYMNAYGPAAGFGKSKDFTVFAQLAPRHVATPTVVTTAAAVATTLTTDSLDMTSTASIPKTPTSAKTTGTGGEIDAGVIAAITLDDATAGSATISYDGEIRTVRVGDVIPGAGEVLEIVPGAHPVVRTSRGLIVTARRD